MKRTFISILAILGLTAVPAHAGRLDGPPTTLTIKDTAVLIKRAIRVEHSLNLKGRVPYTRSCARRSRLRFRCQVRWVDDFGTWFKGTVEVYRTGTFGSPTTRYSVDVRGDRNDAPRSRYSGSFLTPLRRAEFGKPLILPADMDETRARISVDAPIDPLPGPPDSFDDPPAGSRLVGFQINIENVGENLLDQYMTNVATMPLPAGGKLNARSHITPPCNEPELRLPRGERAQRCIVFELPFGVVPSELRITLDSGFSDETGAWQTN